MSGLDLGPKICLVLFLPSGVTLMALEPHGATIFSWWLVAGVWLLAAFWLWVTVSTHGKPNPVLKRLDWAIRIAVIAGMGAGAVYTLVAAEPFGVTTNPKWLGAKILLYTVAIACGLGIRLQLRSFGPAFGALMTTGSTPEVERALKRAIDGCLPYVWGIWLSVLGAAALGVLKPLAEL
jgi:hypothetical protein